jgi:hypothetical protein
MFQLRCSSLKKNSRPSLINSRPWRSAHACLWLDNCETYSRDEIGNVVGLGML